MHHRAKFWICEIRIFLTVGAVKRPILNQRTKFRNDRSNRCGDIANFMIFQMAAAAILNFFKNQNFNGPSAVEGQYMRHPAKFHQNRSNGCKDMVI